jgi:hypothetical protein
MLLKVIELIFPVRNRCGSGSTVCFAGVCPFSFCVGSTQ